MLSYYLYYPFFLILKFLLRPLGAEISTRHSFFFKKVKFGTSDIDLTIRRDHKDLSNSTSFNRARLKLVKKIIPIMGEVNFVDEVGAKKLQRLANCYEVSRDPVIELLIEVNQEELVYQKYVYVLRLIESDRYNLKNRISKRFKKLSYSLSLTHPKRELEREDVSNYESFRLYLKEQVLPVKSELVLEYIDFALGYSEVIDPSLCELGNLIRFDWDKLIDLKGKLEIDKQLVIECIKWELWGMYTYMPQSQDLSIGLSHVLVLGEFLNSLTDKYRDEINYLTELYNDQI